MESIYWHTHEYHANNTETMGDYLDNINLLNITLVDGTYAEGVDCNGVKYEIHAGGNGDFNNHVVSFTRINE